MREDARKKALDRRLKSLVNAAALETLRTAHVGELNDYNFAGRVIDNALGNYDLRPVSDTQFRREFMRLYTMSPLGSWWDVASAAGKMFTSGAGTAWNTVKNLTGGAFDFIKSGITDTIPQTVRTAGDYIGKAGGTVKDWTTSAFNTAKDFLGKKGINISSLPAEELIRGYVEKEQADVMREQEKTKRQALKLQDRRRYEGAYEQGVQEGAEYASDYYGSQSSGGGGGGGTATPQEAGSGGGIPLPLLIGGAALAFFALSGNTRKS